MLLVVVFVEQNSGNSFVCFHAKKTTTTRQSAAQRILIGTILSFHVNNRMIIRIKIIMHKSG